MEGPRYVKPIVAILFERDHEHLARRLSDLIEANYGKGNPKQGFLYGGQFHTELPVAQRRAAPKKILHPHLREEGREYMADARTLEAEQTRASHGLLNLLQSCKDAQDVRDALPEMVVKLVPELSPLPRTRPPGWPFQNQPLQQAQFNDIVEMLEYFVSNRIL